MKLVTYRSADGPRVAGVRDGHCIDLNHADPALPACIKALLRQGPEALQRAARAMAVGKPMPVEQTPLMPVIPNPEKVICVGLNYADHARETGATPPPDPVIFCKFPTAVIADWQPVVLPKVSQEVDYEAELVTVIGLGGHNISTQDARQHVAGYCCGNDISARDWQIRKPGGQWLLGKSFDTFAPVGPAITTADEVDPADLRIRLRLNGNVMQDSRTSQMIFPVEAIVSYVSQVCTLAPGDLIFTGTPAGVGFSRKPPVFIRPGDVLEVEIEKLGVLRNPVTAAKA